MCLFQSILLSWMIFAEKEKICELDAYFRVGRQLLIDDTQALGQIVNIIVSKR